MVVMRRRRMRSYRKPGKPDENFEVSHGFREAALSVFFGCRRGSGFLRGRLCPLPHRAAPFLRLHLSSCNRDQGHSVRC